MRDVLDIALGWHEAGRKIAVATVVETWGSAPRPVGSQMVVDTDGAMEGSVSGGCVEGAVVTEAVEVIADGQARLLDYGVSDDDAFAVGLACGGRIRVLIEVIPVATLRALITAKAARDPIAYVADLAGAGRSLASVQDYPERFRLDRSGVEPDGQTFVAIANPSLRMVIVGAVHIAQPLVMMARECGYQPIVVDPREGFAAQARFPQTRIEQDWPDEAIAKITIDSRTCVVTLSHDTKLDDPALIAALRSDAFYIGALGSTRTHEARVARLLQAGFSAQDIARIHGPVGIKLGGRHPAEIAVSIMAEVTRVLRTS